MFKADFLYFAANGYGKTGHCAFTFQSRKGEIAVCFQSAIELFAFGGKEIKPFFVIVHNIDCTSYGESLLVIRRYDGCMNLLLNKFKKIYRFH